MVRLSKKWATYRCSYHWFWRTEAPPTGPIGLNVEPTNACNLKCYTCSSDGTRKRGFMDLNLFRKIIDQAPESGVHEIFLFEAGEPMLHKDLPKMVEYVVSKGLVSWLVTNGTLLTREKSEALLDAGLDNMWVSFDGDNKEDYEKMRVGANYEEVIDNIKTFLRLKKERGSNKPFISLQMLKLLENPNQEIDPKFIAQFDGLPLDDISARNPHDWRGEKSGIRHEEWGRAYFPCQVFWSAMSIAWDGRVLGCSADLNGQQIFGDLNNQTIMEVWNGEGMRRHRRLLKQRRYDELDLCANCHANWYEGHPRLFVLSTMPPFRQGKLLVRKVFPKKNDTQPAFGIESKTK